MNVAIQISSTTKLGDTKGKIEYLYLPHIDTRLISVQILKSILEPIYPLIYGDIVSSIPLSELFCYSSALVLWFVNLWNFDLRLHAPYISIAELISLCLLPLSPSVAKIASLSFIHSEQLNLPKYLR